MYLLYTSLIHLHMVACMQIPTLADDSTRLSDAHEHPRKNEVNERNEKGQLQNDDCKHSHNNAEYDEKAANEYTNHLPTAPLTPVRNAVE
jgi:hypothetical protein